MNITSKQYAEALYETLHTAPTADQSEILNNFVQLLADEGRLKIWPAIEAEFVRYDQKATGKIPAEAVFAKKEIAHGKTFDTLKQVLGKELEFKTRVDESLLGGVVIETEDERIDLSLKKQLSNLKKTLSE